MCSCCLQRKHGVLYDGQADGLPVRDHRGGLEGLHQRGAHLQDTRPPERTQGHLHDLGRSRRFPPNR